MNDMQINNTMDWDPTCDRFVVFLDILGFKDMIYRETHESVYDKLLSIHDLMKSLPSSVEREEGEDNMFYVSQFSDSILIISKDDSLVSFRILAFVMRHILLWLINRGIAIKGACAHGKITIDKEKSIFFGQPIIDAYLLEEDVHYYGIVCHNSFEKQVKKENYVAFWEGNFFTAKTKLKSGEIVHANVEWYSWMISSETSLEDIFQTVKGALENIQKQISGKPRMYVDNTLEMAKRALKL